MQIKNFRLVAEPLIWLAFFTFPLVLFPVMQPFIDQGLINPPLKGILITHLLLLLFYYFNYYYALPKYYFPGRIKSYLLILISYLLILFLIMFSDPSYNPLPVPPFVYAKTAFGLSILLRFMMILFLSVGIASYSRLRKTEKEKLASELSYLKAQVNPHFLFNTLNSVYALAVKKSDSAPESILKLSSIMRYAITEAAEERVSLDKEINYMNAYIELEKLRLTDKVHLNYLTEGEFAGPQISPMLLIPLVENTFKHGVSTSETSVIDIRITLNGKQLTLTTKNTRFKNKNPQSNGLGINNVKKRLELLYPGSYTLAIAESGNDFLVNLELTLND